MRTLIVFLMLFAGNLFAEEIVLKNGQAHIVPDGKSWIILNAPVTQCNVCTADVYVKGPFSNVSISGVTFHGEFSFSFSDEKHNEIILFSGTEIWLGDSRSELTIYEQ